MKPLKKITYLLVTVAIFTSCEKETTSILESSKMNEKEAINNYGPMSMLDLLDSGIDLETYFNSRPAPVNSASKSEVYARTESSNLQFYYSAENAACSNLPTENFDLSSSRYGYCTSNYLDENTNTYSVSPGDVLPGISFEVVRNNDYDYINNSWWGQYYSDSDLTSFMNSCGFYIDNSSYYGRQNVLQSNYEYTDLVINFSGNNVYNVSMDLYNWNNTNEIIEIYGASGNLIGTDVVYVYYRYGTFWGVQSIEPISKIVIKSDYYYGYEGIDNVSFGNCTDLDGDGVLNENDPYPTSNMSATLTIGYNNLNIENVFSAEGTTMMDQIDALIAEINAQYNGDNYSYLHRQFISKLSKITYYWTKKRLITRSERSAIYSAASSADVPMSHLK